MSAQATFIWGTLVLLTIAPFALLLWVSHRRAVRETAERARVRSLSPERTEYPVSRRPHFEVVEGCGAPRVRRPIVIEESIAAKEIA